MARNVQAGSDLKRLHWMDFNGWLWFGGAILEWGRHSLEMQRVQKSGDAVPQPSRPSTDQTFLKEQRQMRSKMGKSQGKFRRQRSGIHIDWTSRLHTEKQQKRQNIHPGPECLSRSEFLEARKHFPVPTDTAAIHLGFRICCRCMMSKSVSRRSLLAASTWGGSHRGWEPAALHRRG